MIKIELLGWPRRASVLLIALAVLSAVPSAVAAEGEQAQTTRLELGVPRGPDHVVPAIPTKVGSNPWTAPDVPNPEGEDRPFLPTMDPALYRLAKAYANLLVGPRTTLPMPDGRTSTVAVEASASQSASSLGTYKNFAGPTRAMSPETHTRADTHGAAGLDHYVAVVNRRVDVYSKATGVHEGGRTLAALFGYTTKPLVDPRVIYDSTNGRWIVTAMADDRESTTVQRYWVGVSETTNPLGAFTTYSLDVNLSPSGDEFFDFPQLGHNKDALIVTGNVFNYAGTDFKYSEMFALPKATLYSGQLTQSSVFTYLDPSLAPPIVLDLNTNAYLVSAQIAEVGTGWPQTSNEISMYRAWNLHDAAQAQILWQANVPVLTYGIPAHAAACSQGSPFYDTLDGRFANASTQVGNSVWQTHSVGPDYPADLALPTPKFYEINTATNTTNHEGWFYRSGTSYDWNPSIGANGLGEAFVTWTSTDPSDPGGCVRPEVRFAAREAVDEPNLMTVQDRLIGSQEDLNIAPGDGSEPWGDYSAVSLDPSASGPCPAGRRAWLINEHVPTTDRTNWGSRIGQIGFC
jgi:hypothetical protein